MIVYFPQFCFSDLILAFISFHSLSSSIHSTEVYSCPTPLLCRWFHRSCTKNVNLKALSKRYAEIPSHAYVKLTIFICLFIILTKPKIWINIQDTYGWYYIVIQIPYWTIITIITDFSQGNRSHSYRRHTFVHRVHLSRSLVPEQLLLIRKQLTGPLNGNLLYL